MKTLTIKTIILFTFISSLYSVILISINSHLNIVDYSVLSFLDQFSIFQIPSQYLSLNFYVLDTNSIINRYMIDKDNPFSIFPLLLLLFTILFYWIFKEKNTILIRLSLLFVWTNTFLSFLVFKNFRIGNYDPILLSFLISLILLLYLLWNISDNKNQDTTELKASTKLRHICSYWLDLIFGLSMYYLFLVQFFNEIIPRSVNPILFHIILYKLSMFLYLLAFEQFTCSTFGKYIVGIKNFGENYSKPSFKQTTKYVTFQLIPFWYLIRKNGELSLEEWSKTKSHKINGSSLKRLTPIITALIVFILSSFYLNKLSVDRIKQTSQKHYTNNLQFGSESLARNGESDFYKDYNFINNGNYIKIIDVIPLNDNVKINSFKLDNQISIKIKCKDFYKVIKLKIRFENQKGEIHTYILEKYKNLGTRINLIK